MNFPSLRQPPEIAATKITNTCTIPLRGREPIISEATITHESMIPIKTSADSLAAQNINISITNSCTIPLRGCKPVSSEAIIAPESTIPVNTSTNLMASQATNSTTVYVGDDLIDSIVITSNGPSNDTRVVLNDTFISIVINQESSDGTKKLITYCLGDLMKGFNNTITITITPNIPGIIKNFIESVNKFIR